MINNISQMPGMLHPMAMGMYAKYYVVELQYQQIHNNMIFFSQLHACKCTNTMRAFTVHLLLTHHRCWRYWSNCRCVFCAKWCCIVNQAIKGNISSATIIWSPHTLSNNHRFSNHNSRYKCHKIYSWVYELS